MAYLRFSGEGKNKHFCVISDLQIAKAVGVKREIETLSMHSQHKQHAKTYPGLAELSIWSSGYGIIALNIFTVFKPTISESYLSSLNSPLSSIFGTKSSGWALNLPSSGEFYPLFCYS